MAQRRKHRESHSQHPLEDYHHIPQDRNAVKQLMAGLDQQGADLKNERRRLLEERKRFFGYTDNEYAPESLPSPKFNDSRPRASHRTKPGAGSKLRQLEELLNQIVRDSSQENAEVQRGLAGLRQAHLKIIRNLESGRSQEREKLDSQRPSGDINNPIPSRFRELKLLIDKIVKDCQIENEGVRKSLNNIKVLQEAVQEEVERSKPRRGRSQFDQGHRQMQSEYPSQQQRWRLQQHEADVRELAPELLVTDSSVEAPERIDRLQPQSSSVPSSFPSVHEQLENLEELESRIFYQVLSLRDEKLKLINDLNEQIKHSNAVTRELKRYEKQFGRVGGAHRRDESEVDSQSIIHKLGHDHRNARSDSETIKLKQKIRKLEVELERVHDYHSKNQSTRISGGYEKTIAKLEHALDNADAQISELQRVNAELQGRPSRRNTDQGLVGSLREKVRALETQLQGQQERNAQLESSMTDYRSVKEALTKLKHENEELRVETIKLLKVNGSETQELQNEINRLNKKLAEVDLSKARFTDEIGGYINKIKTGQDTIGRNYATYGTIYGGTAHARYDSNTYDTGLDIGRGDDKRQLEYKNVLSGLRNVNLDAY